MLLPNIPTNTLGGEVFWKTGRIKNGFKLQKNMITRHFRILDSSNRRIAWTTNRKSAFKAFDELSTTCFPFIKNISEQ